MTMAKIENERYRLVSFCKRRKGLFKKAQELSALTGARTAVIVVSGAGRPSASASGEVVEKFLSGDGKRESLVGELLGAEVGDCEGLEELWALKQDLEKLRDRVCLAWEKQFVDSVFK